MTDNNNNLNTKSLNHRAPSSTGLSSLSTNSSSSSSSALSNNSSPNTSSISASLVNKPSIIEYKHYRFLIMDAPTESNIFAYIEMLKKKGVVAVVRACEPTYNSDTLIKAGIKVMEAPFPDGDPPADSIIDQWLALVQKEFDENNNNNNKSSSNGNNNGNNNNNNNNKDDNKDNKHTIAVHCVAGLGRAPILVAIALMEAGMAPLDVIDFVRKRRRGAFNSKQLKYIQAYKPRKEKKNDCLIM